MVEAQSLSLVIPGRKSDEEKQQIISHPPDILLTNYVMMELILTRPQERNLIEAAKVCNSWCWMNCTPTVVGKARTWLSSYAAPATG